MGFWLRAGREETTVLFGTYFNSPNVCLTTSGRCSQHSRESLSLVLSAMGRSNPNIGDMILELCVTELEDVATDTERFKGGPQPATQERSHQYTGEYPLVAAYQCDQIEWFSNVFGCKLSYKTSPNVWWLLGYFGKQHFKVKTAVASFWANFGNILGTFYFNIWSHVEYSSRKKQRWISSTNFRTDKLGTLLWLDVQSHVGSFDQSEWFNSE